jgi:hypothetical protein
MNGRMTLAAVVLLIAASGVMPKPTAEQAKLAGTYTARIELPAGAEVATLVLAHDGSARFTRAREDGSAIPVTGVGVWTVDGGAVQAAFGAPGDRASKVAVAFEVEDGALVARDLDPSRWGPPPLALRRVGS